LALAGQSLFGQSAGTQPIATEFERLHFRSIGPAQASGRVSDIAAYEANPSIFYVGSAHGGVWKTTNNGATFTPQFQQVGMMSVGDLAVSQKDADLVWLGTGESNNRQSTSWGDGLWKSTDGGANWKHMGLEKSYHINRIVIDPDDNNVVLVAATGALFGSGGERGVYKTTDGGTTWKQVLKGDEWTGANDLVMAASDHKVLYASLYQRERTQCCFNGGGPGSGIYKSVDGGDTWTKLTNGLPAGQYGRIALDVYRRSANIVYAEIQGESAGGGGGRGGGGGAGGGGGRGGAGGGRGAAGAPPAAATPDPNAAPTAAGDGIYRSDDGGATWRKTAVDPDGRPLYFSQLRIDPNNPDRVLVASVRLSISMDGGRTFVPADQGAVHDDKHAIWWDPNNSNHILIGTDGGSFQTWDMTKTWIWFPNLPIATFYHADYDNEYPYNVCGGMQDNYDWCGPSAVRTSNGITNDRWHTVQGGDGFETLLDKRDARIVYTESQDGNITRRNRVTGESKSIRPNANNTTDPQPGAYRFHWDTPLMFAPNDPGILYAGGNKLFKSTDKGDTWTAISPDLTQNANRNEIPIMGVPAGQIRIGLQGAGQDGIQSWPNIVAITESGKTPGVYYTGTDDGTVSVSKDGGKTWDKTLADRMPGFVKGAFVSEVVASRYDAGTVYITSDAHRLNEYETHMWVSHDFGATFQSLNGNLHGEAVKTLTEDQKNPDVLYIGTETGIFLSLDRGKSWRRLKVNFPFIRTDEITLHARDNAMIVATHGRGMWILDHLSPIQEYTQASTGAADAHLFTPEPALQWRQWDDRNDEFWGHQFYVGENPPTQAVINMYFKKALNDVKLKITDSLGKDIRELVVPTNKLQPGIQTMCWDQRVEPLPAAAGAAAAAGAGGGGNRGGGGGAGAGGAGGGAGAAGAGAGGAIDPALAAQFGGRGGGRGTTLPQPEAGYGAMNPCGAGGGGRGGGGGFGGAGGGSNGPLVLPGTYNVALLVDGKAVMTKPIKIVGDPMMQMTEAQRKRYYDVAMELHDMQRRGEQMATALGSLGAQLTDADAKLKDSKATPAEKTQFTTFKTDFDALQAKFAAPAGGGGGRGGRGGGGGAAAGGGRGAGGGGAAAGGAAAAGAADAGPGAPPAGFGAPAGPPDRSLIGRVGTLKTNVLSFEEVPSDTYVKEFNELKLSVPKAMADANAFLVRAMGVSQTLKKYGITLTVPAPVK
jgi:hypothetical protein